MPNLHAIALILAIVPSWQERQPPDGRRERPAGPAQGRAKAPEEAPPAPKRKKPDQILREEAAARDALAAAASERLRAVELELAAAWLARRPSFARRLGLPPRDLDDVRIGLESRRLWQRSIERARGELQAVDWAALGPARRKDHGRLVAFLEAEARAAQLVPVERWSPSSYLREVSSILLGVSRAAELTPDERLGTATAHLLRLPDVLARARADLLPPARAAQHALRYADELDALLDDALTARLVAGGPRRELWRPYQESRTAARAAASELGAWIAEVAREGGRLQRVGADAWRRMLASATGAEVDLAALKVRLMRDAAEIGVHLGPGEDAEEPAPRLTKALAGASRATLAAGWKAARQLELVHGEAPEVAVEPVLALGPPGAPIELAWDVAADGTTRARLAVIVGGRGWSDAETARRKAELATPALRASLLRHGFPGELLWETWARASEHPSYRVLWNETLRSGWGLYAADVATRLYPADNALARDAALGREVARARRLEALRLYASLRLHAEDAQETEVARELAGLTGLAPELAAAEVLEAQLDPMRGAGYLGYLELLRVERSVEAEEHVAAAFVGRILRRSPSGPPGVFTESPEVEPRGAPAVEGRGGPLPDEPVPAEVPPDEPQPAPVDETEDSLNTSDAARPI